jgi:Uma2 family endonuclease
VPEQPIVSLADAGSAADVERCTSTGKDAMSTRAHDQPSTAEELLGMPDDGFRYELVRGELRRMSPAGRHHGRVAARILVLLAKHVDASDLGELFAAETGFWIERGPDTVRAPDVAFIRRARAAEFQDEEGYAQTAPDLAVEVVSPNDRRREVAEKAVAWLDAGTRMVLVIDPSRRTATVYSPGGEVRVLTEEDFVEGGSVVPGWRVRVKEFFT